MTRKTKILLSLLLSLALVVGMVPMMVFAAEGDGEGETSGEAVSVMTPDDEGPADEEEPAEEPTTPTTDEEEPTTPTEDEEEPAEEPTTPTEDEEEPAEEPTTPTEDEEEPAEEPTTPTEDEEEPAEEPTTPTEDEEEPTTPTEDEEEPVTPSGRSSKDKDSFPFTDVPADAYFRKAVEWAVKKGITVGTTPTTFSPYLGATRGAAIQMLWIASGMPEPTSTDCPFTDVSASDYFYKAVLWAYEKNITAGISADKFGPEKTVSRCQFLTWLYGVAGRPAAGSEPFEDVNEGDYFAAPVAWAYNKGITAGTSATMFSPNNACLRCQLVTFLYLYFGE